MSAATAFIKDLYEPEDLLAFMLMRSGEAPLHWFVPSAEAATSEFVAKLSLMNDRGFNVYVAMNPFKAGSTHRKIENVAVVRNVWTEIDEDGPEKLANIFASKLIPDPSIVLESSPRHTSFIWKVKDLTPDEASALVKSLTAEFGGDPNATDLARVLRVPGFAELQVHGSARRGSRSPIGGAFKALREVRLHRSTADGLSRPNRKGDCKRRRENSR